MYTELVVPLVSPDWDWPVIKTASFEGAARYVDHSLTGGDTTWSVGGRLAPRLPGWGDGLTFRGVYTEAIRSPAIRELFTNTPLDGSDFADLAMPMHPTAVPIPRRASANCAAALAAVGVRRPGQFRHENRQDGSRRPAARSATRTWKTKRPNPGRWASCFNRLVFRSCGWRSIGRTST